MEDLRHRRTQEEMESIPTTEEKYAVMINDTIKSLFIKDDMEHEVKHDINLEEFSNPENFNKFFVLIRFFDCCYRENCVSPRFLRLCKNFTKNE